MLPQDLVSEALVCALSLDAHFSLVSSILKRCLILKSSGLAFPDSLGWEANYLPASSGLQPCFRVETQWVRVAKG